MTLGRELAMIAALVVLGLAVNATLSHFYLNRVFDGGHAERTQAQYDAVRDTVHTLILGDSHSKYGIAATNLDDAFNLALNGQTAPETYYVLRSELQDPAVDLRWVILPADALTFSSWQAGHLGIRHWYAGRVDYLEIGRRRGEPLRYGVNQLLGRYAPYVGRRFEILIYLVTGHAPLLPTEVGMEMERGSFLAQESWADRPESERQEIARKRVEIHFPDPEFDEVAGEYFRRSLELVRDEGVTAVVVRFPLTQEYLLAGRSFMESARVDERLARIFADHAEVRVIDARFDYVGRPDLFMDPDHLNGRGARLLSRRIRRLLENREG